MEVERDSCIQLPQKKLRSFNYICIVLSLHILDAPLFIVLFSFHTTFIHFFLSSSSTPLLLSFISLLSSLLSDFLPYENHWKNILKGIEG